MKRILVLLVVIGSLGCQKNEIAFSPVHDWHIDLQKKLSAADYSSLDLSKATKIPYPSGEVLYRIPIMGRKLSEAFLLIGIDANQRVTKGTFIGITETNDNDPFHFNGRIEFRALNNQVLTCPITNGKVQYPKNKAAREAEPELEEVIIICTYPPDTGIEWSTWMNLLALLNRSSVNDVGWYTEMTGGGGGGTYSDPTQPPIQIDEEHPEYKDAVDPKKYIDCFSNVPDNGASFQITIAADIPIDSDPNSFFSWKDGSPGHTYIELYKLGGSGGAVIQALGFYPNAGWKLIATDNTDAKVADDGSHEYNAKYTINVNASQFQSALTAIQTLSTKQYNINNFNCVDWALGVINAAGAGLSISKYVIPGNTTLSNTPQGLYKKISELAANGNPNASTNGKAYNSPSKGPCN
jgi:hypothetical protein